MTRLRKIACFGWLAFASTAQAAGIYTIQGRLTTISEDEYVVETPKMKYRIARKAIAREIADHLDRTEVDVALSVPPSAINHIDPQPSAPKKPVRAPSSAKR